MCLLVLDSDVSDMETPQTNETDQVQRARIETCIWKLMFKIKCQT